MTKSYDENRRTVMATECRGSGSGYAGMMESICQSHQALDALGRYGDDRLSVPVATTAERLRQRAQRSAARGIQSTLSIPIVDGETVMGGVNLYGSRASTFDGRTHEFAELFGAWAAGAITNADLTFQCTLGGSEGARAVGRHAHARCCGRNPHVGSCSHR